MSKFTTLATIASLVWPKPKAQTKRWHSPAKMVLSGSATYGKLETCDAGYTRWERGMKERIDRFAGIDLFPINS